MRRNMLGLAALTVALAIGLSGCGGSDTDDQVASAGGGGQQEQDDSTKTDDAELGRKFAACMRAEGIDVPDPGPGGGVAMKALPAGEEGAAQARKQDAAMEKCREFLPTGGEAAKLSPEDMESMREYSRCMRSNGLPDFPDPDPATGAIRIDPDAEVDQESVRTAAEACQGVGPGAVPAIGGAG